MKTVIYQVTITRENSKGELIDKVSVPSVDYKGRGNDIDMVMNMGTSEAPRYHRFEVRVEKKPSYVYYYVFVYDLGSHQAYLKDGTTYFRYNKLFTVSDRLDADGKMLVYETKDEKVTMQISEKKS